MCVGVVAVLHVLCCVGVCWCVVFTGCSVAAGGVVGVCWCVVVWLLVVDWLEWLVCCVILHHPLVIVGVVG